MKRKLTMRKLYVGLLLSLGWCYAADATPAGRYVANEDIKTEIVMGKTVAGTMLLKKGRQFQVTGADGEFIQIELGQELRGRLPRTAETKIALAAAETPQVPNPVTTVDNARPPQPENPAETSPPKPAGALAIKGVYIGMDAAEAVRVLNAHLPDKIRVAYAYTRDETVVYNIRYYGISDTSYIIDWRDGGAIYANLNTRKVTRLFLWSEVGDLLFNTADLSANSFAKKLVDNYPIPELKPVTIGDQTRWHYESPHGWSIYVSGDKTIDLFKTPTRQFD
jgi:hypothetical protein